MMGNRIVEPPDVKRIFDKPGRCWTPEERVKVWKWLFEDEQLRYLLVFALRHLGSGATAEDAEDAWGDFCAERLDSVIDGYDPARGRHFWNYLLLCFERFCHDEGERIRKRRQREEPLEPQIETEEGEFIEPEYADDDESVGPVEAFERKEFLEILQKCLAGLNPKYREVFVLRDIEDLSVKETAERMGCPEGSVKGWLSRAREQLRQCMTQEGWTP